MASEQGFTLIEVLISVLILAVGILGAGALQLSGLQANQGAYFRSQAMFLASDMLDRMRANRAALASYNGIDTDDVTAGQGAVCLSSSAGCSPAAMAASDASQWASYFTVQNVLPGGRGQVVRDAGRYRITITWNERDWVDGNREDAGQSYQLLVDLEDI